MKEERELKTFPFHYAVFYVALHCQKENCLKQKVFRCLVIQSKEDFPAQCIRARTCVCVCVCVCVYI